MEKPKDHRPWGALLVVGVLTVFILTFWLFYFFTFLGRS
ncbi:MAG: cytochrome c oxidase subunit 2A [Meiothermus sp.]